MIAYVALTMVYLDGKHIGNILKVKDGFQYFPKGKKTGGEVFPTLEEVKRSLEDE